MSCVCYSWHRELSLRPGCRKCLRILLRQSAATRSSTCSMCLRAPELPASLAMAMLPGISSMPESRKRSEPRICRRSCQVRTRFLTFVAPPVGLSLSLPSTPDVRFTLVFHHQPASFGNWVVHPPSSSLPFFTQHQNATDVNDFSL